MWVLTLFLLCIFVSLLSCSVKYNNNTSQYESRQYWYQLSFSYSLQAERLLFLPHDQKINNDTTSQYRSWQSYFLQAERPLILHYDQESINNEGSVGDGFFGNLRRHRKLLDETQLFDFTPFKPHVPVQSEPVAEGPDADPLYGEQKRLVPTGPNPLHH